MLPDLQALEISPGEFKHWSGVEPATLFKLTRLKTPGEKWNFFFQEALIALALTPLIVGILYTFIIRPLIGGTIPLAIAILLFTPVTIFIGRWCWRSRSTPPLLLALLEEIDRYHAILRALEISDRIQAVTDTPMNATDRETVISALQLTRSDLINALKTERILRENKAFIHTNPELFANNLTAIQALQLNNQGSEYTECLHQALQIGVSIQAEMRKLQSQHSPKL